MVDMVISFFFHFFFFFFFFWGGGGGGGVPTDSRQLPTMMYKRINAIVAQ